MKRRRWWRWVAGGVAVLVVVYLGLGGWFASRALDRVLTVGVIAEQLEGATPPDSPFELGYRGDPMTAFGYAFEDIAVETGLGPTPAWLVPGDAADQTLWAIYVHGIAGHREDGYRHLSVLHEAGIPTLMVTYRNDADAPPSEEGIYTFGLSEWPDLDAAVSYALSAGAERFIIVGESMGGAITGQFLINAPQADRVVALVLDAPALDLPAVIRAALRSFGIPLSLGIERIALGLFPPRTGIALNTAVSIDAVVDFPGPLFIAHGSGDRIVPVSISDRVVDRRDAPTTYVRTAGDHLQSWHENPERYRAALLGFLADIR
ncbi:MAG: hypothetical protein KIS96_12850 [Bauldia sp.]|nr:hypothetical protein [Bauldia sp.]